MALVFCFHLRESLDRVGIRIRVYDVVMEWTQQDEICKAVSLCFRLSRVVPRTSRTLRFDVANASRHLMGNAIDKRNLTLRKGATISRDREKVLNRCCSWATHAAGRPN